MIIDPSSFTPYDKLFDKKVKTFYCFDHQGNKVIVNHKVIGNHDSHHEIQNHPAIIYNLPMIIKFPDTYKEAKKSGNPKSIENSKKGKVIEFTKYNFVKQTGFYGYEEYIDTTKVFVLYPTDGSENYTLTFRIDRPLTSWTL